MKKTVLLLSLFLVGCSAFNAMTGNVYAPKTAEWVANNAKVTEDKFTNSTRVEFPSLIPRHFLNYKKVTGISAWSAPNSPFWVSIIKSEGEDDLFLIYFDTREGNWSFYDRAVDENGKTLQFFDINKKVNAGNEHFSTTTEEFFALKISKEFLEQNKGNNPQIKVYGKNNSFVFFLPDYYIDGILEYISK